MTLPIKQLKELWEKATQGEWYRCCEDCNRILLLETDSLVASTHYGGPVGWEESSLNADLIVALHNAFPDLIAELERLQKKEKATDRLVRVLENVLAVSVSTIHPELKDEFELALTQYNQEIKN